MERQKTTHKRLRLIRCVSGSSLWALSALSRLRMRITEGSRAIGGTTDADAGGGALRLIAANSKSRAALLRFLVCAATLARLLGGASGIHARIALPTGFGLAGIFGMGGAVGRGWGLVHVGLGILPLIISKRIGRSAAINS